MFVFHAPQMPVMTPSSLAPSFLRIAFAFCAALVVSEVRGTHLVGGDFSYVHLGGDQYEITLKVYRDCGPANINETYFDESVAIGLWDGTGTIEFGDVVLIPLLAANVSEVPVEMGNPCGTPPPDLCIEQAIYTSVVTLPPNAYGWDLVYQRCCRNPTIVNLDNFGGVENAGMTLQVHVPGTDVTTESNSSPEFQELPPVAMCTDLPFVWDHAALDPDGDDLVYSRCVPPNKRPTLKMLNPTLLPPALPRRPIFRGFRWDDPMTADPQLASDPVTGELTCTPTAAGQYAIGICVEEYRDGVLLSTVTRDFQFNVTLCEPTEFELEADAVPFASAGIEMLVPYQEAVGLPDVLTYAKGETFPMAAWIADNDITIDVDGTSMVVDAVVMEGCNDARFTIERPESEAALLDTTYLTLTDGV